MSTVSILTQKQIQVDRSAVGAAVSMDPTHTVKSSDEKFKNWGGYWQWALPTTSYDPTFPYNRNNDAPTNPVEKVENYDFYKSTHILLGNVEADYKIHRVSKTFIFTPT